MNENITMTPFTTIYKTSQSTLSLPQVEIIIAFTDFLAKNYKMCRIYRRRRRIT